MSPDSKRDRPLPPGRPATNNLNHIERTTPSSPGITTDELARYPLAFASRYDPCGRRTRHLLVTGVCPFCGGRHAHLVADPDKAAGVRRAGCGRGTYWLVIARTYATKSPAVAA